MLCPLFVRLALIFASFFLLLSPNGIRIVSMVRTGLRSNSNPPNILPFEDYYETMAEAPPAANPPAQEVVSWTINPLSQNFNPGTSAGSKIFIEKTKGPADGERIGDKVSDSKKFQEYVKAKAIPFGSVVTHIPTAWDADGNVTGYSSIIDQYQSISLEDVQREAHKCYGNELTFGQPIPPATNRTLRNQRAIDPANNDADKPTFFNRVNGTVVAESLNNTMSAAAASGIFSLKSINSHSSGLMGTSCRMDLPCCTYSFARAIPPQLSAMIIIVLQSRQPNCKPTRMRSRS